MVPSGRNDSGEAVRAKRLRSVVAKCGPSKARLSLEIGPSVHIPIGIITKTTSVRLPTLKKRSKLAAAKPAAAAPGDAAASERVIIEHTYHVADDPDGEEVKLEDRVKGHKYGQSLSALRMRRLP